MKALKFTLKGAAFGLLLLCVAGCDGGDPAVSKPRLVLFVGMDISGSFQKGPYASDSKDFLARYLYAHLNGLGGLEKPQSLFVGAIGGTRPGETKSFQPIQAFEGKTVDQIRATLEEIFPAGKYNPATDYNAFIAKTGEIMSERNLALKPVAVVMVTDGKVDIMGSKGGRDYRKIDVSPLERYSRNVTLRLLYTDAESGAAWRSSVPRHRVKVFTQDAVVMTRWKDINILKPDAAPEDQTQLYRWMQENVDFGVRAKRVS